MICKALCLLVITLLIQTTIAQTEITKATALDISMPFLQTVNNDYLSASFEFPNSDWDTLGATKALWYHIPSSVLPRTIRASTCTTYLDTVVGIYYYVAGNPVGALNDDRVVMDASCDQLSSYVEIVIPANTEFYVIVASISPNVGDIDLKVYQYISDSDELATTANTIIASLTTEIEGSEAALQATLTQLSTDVAASNTDLNGDISTLSTSVNTQFTAVQTSLAQLDTDLSAVVDATETAITAQITTLSTNLAAVPSDVVIIKTGTATISTNVQSLLADVVDVQTSADGITSDVAAVATSIATLSADLGSASTGINTNIASLSTANTGRFNSVDSATAAVKSDTAALLTDVAEVNTISQDSFDLLEGASFQRYLIANSTAVAEIPWKYRTPASYLGQMEDLLNYSIAVYNDKLTTCGASTSDGCVWFRSNTLASYTSLVSSYNTQVSAKRFKKAFDVIQSFYLRLYPASLFV